MRLLAAPTLERELMRAASQGDTEKVISCLAKGARPSAIDEETFTPLIEAARNGHQGVCSKLISAVANLHFKARMDWNAITAAASQWHWSTVLILAIAGADVDEPNGAGLTAMDYVAQGCDYPTIAGSITQHSKEWSSTSPGHPFDG